MRCLKTKVSFFVALFACVASAQTLSVDEVIQKNIEARGGAEKWAAMQTFIMSGTYTAFSEPAPFKIWRKRENKYRFDHHMVKMDAKRVYDGEKAWWVFPLMGPPHSKPVEIPSKGDHDKVTLRERFFEPVFWNAAEKGNQVELEGVDDVDGQEAYKLKVTLADSTVENWFIDAESFLAIKMTGDTYDFGRKNALEAFFDDFREVDGLKFPFLIETEYGIRYRVFEVESVEVNAEFGDDIFAMPAAEESAEKEESKNE